MQGSIHPQRLAMTLEQRKTRSRQFLGEVWNAHDQEAVDAFLPLGFREDRPLPGVDNSREGVKEWVRLTCQAFPDIHFTIDELVAEGNTVVTRWTARGTHRDTFMGIPATGKTVAAKGITIARYADGQAQSNYVQWDALGLMQQLGIVPAPKAAEIA
jgi:steroid delta-isomerase-like uncharacterized protein